MNTIETSEPLVSVVIIFFNAKKERFFEEAIESVFAQTYRNWELLLVDDGSMDESCAIAQQYAHGHPNKVHYLEHLNHQNLGMSAARNLGIRHAKGQYVAFLDADDLWLPHKLADQISLLERHPEAAMLYGKTQFWFTWRDKNPVPYFSYTCDRPANPMTLTSEQFNQIVYPPHQLLLYLKDKNIYPCSCSMVIRRQVFDTIGGFEETFRDAHEDMVFHSKLFLHFPVYVSDQCWDRYRIHPNSYWRTVWREGLGRETEQASRLKYLKWLETYLSTLPADHLRVKKALSHAFLINRNPRLHRLIAHLRHPLKLIKNILHRLKQRYHHS